MREGQERKLLFSVKNGSFSYDRQAPSGVGTSEQTQSEQAQKEKQLLQQIHFDLQAGEILCLLGANGSGKSTLIRCLLGFLDWQEGQSLFKGKDIREIEDRDLWKKLAYVPQARYPIFPYSVFEMVLMGRNPHLGLWAQPSKEDEEAAWQAIHLCGLESLAHQSCDRISGGELQMTLIARALAGHPELLIMDEPESSLDFSNRLKLADLLKALSKKRKTAIIMATHDPDLALRLADQILLLLPKGQSRYGTVEEVMREDNLRTAYGVDFQLLTYQEEGKTYQTLLPLRRSEDRGSEKNDPTEIHKLPGKEMSNKELPGKEMSNKELPGKEMSDKEIPGKEMPDKELPGKEMSDKELPGKEMPDKELPDKTQSS